MAKREPKTRQTNTIEVVGRAGDRKGWLEMSSGTVTYFRPSAREPTLQLTYQQLISLLEREVTYQEVDERVFKLPRQHEEGDFILSVSEVEIDDSHIPLVESKTRLMKLDARRIDQGAYQFSQDMQNGRKPKRYTWFTRLSIQAACGWYTATSRSFWSVENRRRIPMMTCRFPSRKCASYCWASISASASVCRVETWPAHESSSALAGRRGIRCSAA